MNTESAPKIYDIVACGTLRLELRRLKEEESLNADRLLFTAPGLHEKPQELESQLKKQLAKAKSRPGRVVVVYGSKCFVDAGDPLRGIDTLIREEEQEALRMDAANCIDMLTTPKERETMADGENVYWITPGWLQHWRYIFQDWDDGKANETFPRNDKAVLLDGIGFFEQYMQEHPDEVLAFSDWMGIPIEPQSVSLDRFRKLLWDQLQKDT